MNPQQIAALVKSEINKAVSNLATRSIYRAEVVAVAGNRCNVIMEHATGVHPNLLCMSGYQPMVGDQVLILNIGLSGSNFVVIGRTNVEGVSGAPIGELQMTLKNGADPGFILMTGGTFTKADYPKLWDVVASNPAYGTYDSGTFTLADMRQRMPLGKSSSGTGSTLGETGGHIDHRHGSRSDSATGSVSLGFGSSDMRAAIGATDSNPSRLGYITLSSSMPDGGSRPGYGYSVQGSSSSGSGSEWNHFTGVYGYTNQNNPPYIAVNYQVRAR